MNNNLVDSRNFRNLNSLNKEELINIIKTADIFFRELSHGNYETEALKNSPLSYCAEELRSKLIRQKKDETALNKIAVTDPLTKVYNRRAGFEALKDMMTYSDKGMVHCIAFIDIDDLKEINDKFGHVEGDRAIQAIAGELLTSVREKDIVCRYGGDEFMIVFTNCRKEAANRAVERTLNNIDKLNKSGGYQYILSFSYGLAEFIPEESQDIKAAIEHVDKLMYENKARKKAANGNNVLKLNNK